ncbi:MAG: MetQ/NlpA family ABC transporter substrate-binding protein [Bacilli bacterium]
MKKTVLFALLLPLALTACGGRDYLLKEGQTEITVAVSPTPHGVIMEKAAEILEADGYTVKVNVFTDYVLPNLATESGEVAANYFQHLPYLEDFNKNNKTHLVTLVAVHYEPLGIYAGLKSDLANVESGDIIAVPNDTTNEARSLLLLEAQGLITLKQGVGLEATKLDIIDNPFNLDIVELAAAQITNALQDVDFAVVNGNYALAAKLPSALVLESKDSLAATTYANLLVVRDGNQNHPAIKALADVLTSEAIKEFIVDTFGDAVVPVF